MLKLISLFNISKTIMRHKIKESFNRAAKSYDKSATVQKIIADDLLNITKKHIPQAKNILELGSGTGYLSKLLAQHYPDSQLLISDCAERMLNISNQSLNRQHIACYSEQLPTASKSQNLVISSLMLQWCDHIKSFNEINRVIKDDGEFILATLGPNTLQALSQCYQQAHKIDHINPLPKLEYLQQHLEKLNLSQLKYIKKNYSIPYTSHYKLIYAISKIGSLYNHLRTQNGLITRSFFKRLDQTYQQLFPTHKHIMASYEVFFIYGKK